MADIPNPTFLLGVQRHLARSNADLQLMFDVIRGPKMFEDIAWRLELTKPRHDKLADFKVAVLPSIMDVHCSSQVQKKLEELVGFLSSSNCHMVDADPGFDFTD
jgi:amidase